MGQKRKQSAKDSPKTERSPARKVKRNLQRMEGGQCRRKIGHRRERDASRDKRTLEAKGESGLHVYPCGFCGRWHVGHVQ